MPSVASGVLRSLTIAAAATDQPASKPPSEAASVLRLSTALPSRIA